jgi:hypothetical protein
MRRERKKGVGAEPRMSQKKIRVDVVVIDDDDDDGKKREADSRRE